jgi:RHS repeat-associated protein
MNSYIAAVRKCGRMLSFFLLLLLILGTAGSHQARANGVVSTIGNGQVVYGSVSGTNYDTYSFPVPSGAHVVWTVTATTAYNSQFMSEADVYKPGGGFGAYAYGYYFGGNDYATGANPGTYSIEVRNYFGGSYPTVSGSYALEVFVLPGLPAQSGGVGGGQMNVGQTYDGSINLGSTDVYNFNGVSGNNYSLTLTKVSGSTNFYPWMAFSDSTGATNLTTYATTTTTATHAATTGPYTVLVNQYYAGANYSGDYSLEVSGAGVADPTAGKQDGSTCNCDGDDQIAQINPDSANPNGATDELASVSPTGGAEVGDPINLATGNVYEKVVDYTTVGTNKLSLIRSYNSMSYTRNLFPRLMGENWRTNFDRYIRVVSASAATAERPDGRVVNFALSSGTGTPDSDVDVKLTYSGSTYTLTTSDDVVETYSVTSGKGVLSTIAYPNGYTLTFNYTSGVLTSVSDSYSRSLSFTYTSGVLTGVSTPDSATLTYGYTTTAGQSLLTSVTYNTSPSTNQTYVYGNTSYPFMLTGVTDENGNGFASYTYDGQGRCTMSEHAGGADEVQVVYNSNGTVAVTGPLGNVETYSFTTVDNMSKVSQIVRTANSPVAAATRYFTYDANGYLATATDWDGNSTHWTNNSHGQPTSITEAYGTGRARTTSITYDSTWVHKPYTTTKTNVTIDDRYNASTGTLTSHTLTDTTGGATNGNTEVWAYTYNGTGEMLTETFPRTGTTVKNTYTYSSGALASVTDQLSHAITISTANGTGQPTKILDANSVETDFVYDNRNRLTSKTVKATPSNEVTTYSYIASGQPYVTTLPDSSTLTRTYDNAQRLTKIANTAGETINYTLDAMGDITAYTAKDSGGTTRKSWTATYDVLGDRLTRVGSAGATQTTTYTYDGNKNRLSVEDANSKTTSLAWDALNRPSTVTDPNSNTAAPTYNNLDQITAQTDFNGYSTSYTRDAFGNAIKRVSPDTGTVNNTFDEDNNLTGRTDARSVVSAQTFDAADRLTATTFTGYSGENIAYTYDSTSGGNVGVGRLTSLTDESGSTAITYDNFGRITKEVRVSGTQTYTTSFSYDLANRLTEIIYPSGRYVDYTYDSSGYLTTVTTKPSSGGTVTTLASSITHKPFGPISGMTLGNTLTVANTFDNNYWLDDIVTSNGSTHIQSLTYAQDYVGNLTSITDNLAAGRDETYTVDSLNRLHTASGAYGSRTYTYDNNGNRSTWYDGTTTRTSTLTTSTNLLASITDGTNTRHFTNSASGNMLTDDRVMNGGTAVSMTYGGRDRLESITVGTPTVTFKVNAFGQRVQKATTGATTDYIHDIRGNIIAEADDSTGTTAIEYIFAEGQLLAQVDSSGNLFYAHNNQIGAPQKMTNSSMTIVFDREQEPFGEDYATPTNTTPTQHRFPGQYADAEDLLSQNNNREYDPTIGYIEADPIGLAGGLNPRAYAGNNPTQNIDPSGLIVDMVLDPATNTMTATDRDTLRTVTVDAFTGGHSDANGITSPSSATAEVPADAGSYFVVANPSNNPAEAGWFGVYRNSDEPSDYYTDANGDQRSGLRLHKGHISDGCITVDKYQQDADAKWQQLQDMLQNTKTQQLPYVTGPNLWNGWDTTTEYGVLTIKK